MYGEHHHTALSVARVTAILRPSYNSPARSRQQPAAGRPPAGQGELGAALDSRPTCTSTAGAREPTDSQFSDKSEILGNIRGLNEETPNEYMRSRAPPTHFMDIYIDDCVIVTASYATHVRALKRFLEACRAERMYVNQKAILGCKSITYVGYSVSYDGV